MVTLLSILEQQCYEPSSRPLLLVAVTQPSQACSLYLGQGIFLCRTCWNFLPPFGLVLIIPVRPVIALAVNEFQ